MDLFYSFSLSLTTLGCLYYLKDCNFKVCLLLLIIKMLNIVIINTVKLSPCCELILFFSLDLLVLLLVTETHMKITILTDLITLIVTIEAPTVYQPINEFDICVCSNLYCISVNTEKRCCLFFLNISLFTIVIFLRYAET